MLLFIRDHVEPILSGRKTQTRRRGGKRWNVGTVHQARTTMFGDPFAYLLIAGVYRQALGDMPADDALREGYDNLLAYREVWVRINKSWDPKEAVWVVNFSLYKMGEKK